MERALQQIFQSHFAAYCTRHKVCAREYCAARAILQCRTADLGGHVEFCPHGHFIRSHYNSCKHRSCPQCNGLLRERWLQKQKARLLNCPHHHLIFTIPHELLSLWLYNRSPLMDILFTSVNHALLTLLKAPRYMGATPGMLLAFHSWGRNLSLHPHIHCLITDGGLDSQGQWQEPKRSHFLPIKVLMLVYRGILTQQLHRGLEHNSFSLPDGTDRFWWHARLKRIKAKAWNVHLRERYDHVQGLAHYLARYVRGGPVRNTQLGLEKHQVVLHYQSHQTGKPAIARFTPERFITQYLQHIQDKGRQVVRSYGLYANKQNGKLTIARQGHHQAAVKDIRFLDWQTYMKRFTDQDFQHCPHCQSLLLVRKIFPHQQSPPSVHYAAGMAG